jgi:hypothetical protein
VTGAFGSWSEKPFALVVLVAFASCATAAQSSTACTMYSIARDGVLPGAGYCAAWTWRPASHVQLGRLGRR